MGYGLTLDYGVPHGLACSVFDPDFIEYNMKTEEGERLLKEFSHKLGSNLEDISSRLSEFYKDDLVLKETDIEYMVSRIENAGNFKNSPYVLKREEITEIFRKHFG